MIIWILAILLIASVAALGSRQGGIRVAFSFVGIVVGALLAAPLGHLISLLLGKVGIKDPLLLWALGPIIVFILVSAGFKTAAYYAHQKVDVYYKYKGGDLRLALWERLNQRLGLCLGVLNGVAYAVLLAFIIYVPSYATVQFESSDEDPKWLRVLSSLGRGLQATGMDKVARAIDSTSEVNYRMIDLAALLYRNPLAEARLANYPGFLSLSELPEFAELSTDKAFIDPWQRQVPIMQMLDLPRVQNVRHNPALLKTVWEVTERDLDDLRTYLKTGRSAKYDPIKILGRWDFSVNAALGAIRRAKPHMSSRDMQAWRHFIDTTFGKTTLIARPDHSVALKNAPGLKLPATAAPAASSLQNFSGEWKDVEGKYLLTLAGNDLPASVDGDRLTVKSEGTELVFDREY
jgi:hypothetical protein